MSTNGADFLSVNNAAGVVAATTSSVRHSNLALVAGEIFGNPTGISRADVAAKTGLTRATVSRLVAELLSLDMVVEGRRQDDGKPGRPGTLLLPAAGTMVALGMEVNVDRVAGYALDLRGTIIDSFSVSIGADEFTPELPLELIKSGGTAMMDRLRQRGAGRILSVQVAVPGVVDAATNVVTYAPNLRWRDVDLPKALREMLGDIPLIADNDAKMQVDLINVQLGDSMKRPGSFLYISGDIGIGGAIVDEGEAIQGLHGWAGEIGHITIDANGPICHCGSRGCLERYAGQREILIACGLPLSATPADVVASLKAGDPQTHEAVERAGWALGVAISNVVNLLDIGDVVLGTALAPLVPWLLPSVREQLDQRVLARSAGDIGIHATPEGPHPASVGGALRALNNVIKAPATYLS